MNLNCSSWNYENYQQFLQWLTNQQDIEYQKFHSKLILEECKVIGIRMPILKQIAKEISKGNYKEFLIWNEHFYYEEKMIHGLLLGNIKIDFASRLNLLNEFLPFNQNWAINDGVCANLKQFKNNQEQGYLWILTLIYSNHPWKIRFGIVLLLDYYINDNYIEKILEIACKTYPSHYYVEMAIAWLLSFCYIKYPEKTEPIIESKRLNSFIQNKTISKIRDSYRVTKEKKDYLKRFFK